MAPPNYVTEAFFRAVILAAALAGGTVNCLTVVNDAGTGRINADPTMQQRLYRSPAVKGNDTNFYKPGFSAPVTGFPGNTAIYLVEMGQGIGGGNLGPLPGFDPTTNYSQRLVGMTNAAGTLLEIFPWPTPIFVARTVSSLPGLIVQNDAIRGYSLTTLYDGRDTANQAGSNKGTITNGTFTAGANTALGLDFTGTGYVVFPNTIGAAYTYLVDFTLTSLAGGPTLLGSDDDNGPIVGVTPSGAVEVWGSGSAYTTAAGVVVAGTRTRLAIRQAGTNVTVSKLGAAVSSGSNDGVQVPGAHLTFGAWGTAHNDKFPGRLWGHLFAAGSATDAQTVTADTELAALTAGRS